MRQLLITALLLCTLLTGFAQLPIKREVEIGVVEKLEDTIPLDLKFLNEKGDTVVLASLINKPTILSFVYFDCPGMCNPLLEGVADVISKVNLELGKDFDAVTISFNPRDTPEKAVAKKINFTNKIAQKDLAHWTFLTGELNNIQKITEAVGFRYKPTGLDFAHPSTIIMLSPKGKVTRYLYGVTYLPFDVKMAVVEAQKGEARPTSSKLLDYCFAYDAKSKSYSLQITRLIGIFSLVVGLFFLLILWATRKK